MRSEAAPEAGKLLKTHKSSVLIRIQVCTQMVGYTVYVLLLKVVRLLTQIPTKAPCGAQGVRHPVLAPRFRAHGLRHGCAVGALEQRVRLPRVRLTLV